jgi:hypothetical protein
MANLFGSWSHFITGIAGAALSYSCTVSEDYNGREVKAGYFIGPRAVQRFW